MRFIMNKYNLYFLFLTFIHILQMKCAYFSFGFDSAISPFNSSNNAFFICLEITDLSLENNSVKRFN